MIELAARTAARCGAEAVVVTGRRPEAAEGLVDELDALGTEPLFIRADVAVVDQAVASVTETISAFGLTGEHAGLLLALRRRIRRRLCLLQPGLALVVPETGAAIKENAPGRTLKVSILLMGRHASVMSQIVAHKRTAGTAGLRRHVGLGLAVGNGAHESETRLVFPGARHPLILASG